MGVGHRTRLDVPTRAVRDRWNRSTNGGMKITGHKTRSVFDRYNIVTETDLRRATTRLAEYVAAQPTERNVVTLLDTAEGESR